MMQIPQDYTIATNAGCVIAQVRRINLNDRKTVTSPANLDELLVAIKSGAYDRENVADQHALTSLPTFGGTEPNNTVGIWSWDSDRLLIGESSSDFRIVSRTDYAAQHSA